MRRSGAGPAALVVGRIYHLENSPPQLMALVISSQMLDALL